MINKSLIAGAAIAGLLSGSFAAQARTANTSDTPQFKKGTSVSTLANEKGAQSCKGQNSCKGKGGCKSGDNGCKGKNSCKGKGGCGSKTK